MAFVGFVSRVIFGVVFFTAAVRKSSNSAAFAHTIYRIGLGEDLSTVAAWIIIVYEALLGVLFLLGLVPLIAIIMALCLLILFLGVSLRAMLLHQQVRCNCFGASRSLLGGFTLLQASLLLLPVGGYYLNTFFSAAIWWPSALEMVVSSLSLVLGGILVARWLLMARTIRDLALSRKQSDRDAADGRAQGFVSGTQ
jgi:uncharacterized membrane protein YphA (DoxX/SURF4 family)